MDGIAVQQASASAGVRKTPVQGTESTGKQEEARRGRVPWPLIGVLAVQAALSLRLTRGWAAVAAIPIVACTLLESIPQATALFSAWTNVSPIAASMPGLIARYPGDYLTSTDLYQVLGYYDQGHVGWSRWQSDLYFSVAGAPPGLASDRTAIKGRYFSLIVIVTRPTTITNTDESVIAYLRQVGGYRVVADTGGIEAWTPVESS